MRAPRFPRDPSATWPPRLSDQHRRVLEGSAIAPDVVVARGYRTAKNAQELRAAGFPGRDESGLLIPIRDVTGETQLYQFRRDEGSPKYLVPKGARQVLDVPPWVRPHLDNPAHPLWITEGAKKVDSLVSRDVLAVGINGVWGWRGTVERGGKTALPDWESVAVNGRRMLLVFDSDVMSKWNVALALERFSAFLVSRGGIVRIVYLPAADGEKVGVDDFLAAGGRLADLNVSETLRTPTGFDAAELCEVVGLAALEKGYDDAELAEVVAELRKIRLPAVETVLFKDAAKRHLKRAGVSSPTEILNHALAAREDEAGENDAETFQVKDAEAWPELVSLGDVVESIVELLSGLVRAEPEDVLIIAWWLAQTFVAHVARKAPHLCVLAPDIECGKSTLIDACSLIARKPIVSSNMTAACLFRLRDKHPGTTLVLDEADKTLNENQDLQSILNASYCSRTGFATRAEGDDHEPRTFRVYGPVVLAMNGHPPRQTKSRSIVIRMERMKQGDRVRKIHAREEKVGHELRRKLTRLMTEVEAEIKARCGRNEASLFPDGLGHRQEDNYESMLHLAEVAGPAELEQLQLAILKHERAQPASDVHDPVSLQLLEALNEALIGRDMITWADLSEFLGSLEDGSWATYNRGKPITAKQVKKHLSVYGVGPERPNRVDRRSYYVRNQQFQRAAERYLNGAYTATCGDSEPPDLLTPSQPYPITACDNRQTFAGEQCEGEATRRNSSRDNDEKGCEGQECPDGGDAQ